MIISYNLRCWRFPFPFSQNSEFFLVFVFYLDGGKGRIRICIRFQNKQVCRCSSHAGGREVASCSPCPARRLPSCLAGTPRPAHAARIPGSRCHTHGPGRAPWTPCGPAQRMLTSLAVPELHLGARMQGVRDALQTQPPPPQHQASLPC